MNKLAVIGTFYQRHFNTYRLLKRVIEESVKAPDEFYIMCEGEDDTQVAYEAYAKLENIAKERGVNVIIQHLPTPRNSDGRYAIVPYSNKINWALDRTACDYIVYLDNNSTPHINKYELMFNALENNPEWNAVYCNQHRTGYRTELWHANYVIHDAFCVLNYTQVMHKLTKDRWTLEMQYAVPNDIADGMFWRSLHKSLGSFYPAVVNERAAFEYVEMLDEHYAESVKAVGVD